MHIAILMVNTDESAFADRHPRDCEKFTDLVQMVRPDWDVTCFAVKDGFFPDASTHFDGIIITGSPASVHDTDPWVSQLQELIRIYFAQQTPLFGACYGHQAIACALGGTVGPNPHGWVFGQTKSNIIARTPWTKDLPETLIEYAAHIEMVTRLPKDAQTLSVSDKCAVTGYRIGDTVYTTQNHPEMTPGFVAALVSEYHNKLPDGVGDAAKASLTQDVDQRPYAETIACFFEQASTD
jgi:GMP synthase-like glutamine amidotransferase